MGALRDLLGRLDPDPNRRGKQFEHICKWFLENDPAYQSLLRRVWLWDDWPEKRGIDAGIDLVAEDHDGKLWAIQAKAYDPAYSVSKRDVDKFIAESSRKKFTYRLLIGTTDKRHHLATKLMDDLDIPFIGLTQLRDADDYLDWPSDPGSLRPSKPPKPKQPWDYQRPAINNVVKGFETADRGQLIMACGTGKTLTAWFIKERLAAKRTLVLVPSLSLLKQTMLEWQIANPRKPFPALPVCSDETVGSPGEDAAVSHTSSLGVPVTTDPTKIAEFLRKRSGPRVVFSTYQSSPQIAAAFELGRVPPFDLIVADEAHRVTGPVSSDFATVLDGAAIKGKRRLFMTATPRYFTGRVMRAAVEVDYEVASMDDETRFGAVFHQLTFNEAIERDLLTDYQVAIIGVDDTTYRDWAERGTLVTLDGKKKTDARSLAGQVGLAKAMKKFDLHRVISFHSRVKAAREFAASMPAVLDWMPARQRPKGQLWSKYASGDMSAGERAVLLQHLKRLDSGERGLLANARCLSEGVDVPALDGVAFIDPRRSEVDIIQAVGRAIRKSESKTVGTIVIPVFIDTDEDAEVALDSSAFKPVWDVIKALRAHDVELGEELDELRRERGRLGKERRLGRPDKILFDLPAKVGVNFARAFDVRLVEQTTTSWEYSFGVLKQFVDCNGHALVPRRHEVAGCRLGNWVSNQRSFYARGILRDDRRRTLEAVPGWTWDTVADNWEKSFNRLLDYAAHYGHARVPQSYKVDSYPLGWWVAGQRSAFVEGRLDQDREQRLRGVPGWTWDPHTDRWEDAFSRLVDYVDVNGDARVPGSYTVDGFNLGGWVKTQRQFRSRGVLDADRQRRLQELPRWTWDTQASQWEEGFGWLKKYVDLRGDARVPGSFALDGYPLGSWLKSQRNSYAWGSLDADRRTRLESLPGWTWDARTAEWEDAFSRLVDYVDLNGDARVPASHSVDGFKLGTWVRKQRELRSGGRLDADRQRRLQVLSGWTWNKKGIDEWEEFFSRLVRYVEHHNHARVPVAYSEDGYRLGAWINGQRNRYANGSLDADRRRRLEAVAGWTWDARTAEWEDAFSRLVDYVDLNGDARVPASYTVDGFKLGGWVKTQRRFRLKGRLSTDRERRLEDLRGWRWNARSST